MSPDYVASSDVALALAQMLGQGVRVNAFRRRVLAPAASGNSHCGSRWRVDFMPAAAQCGAKRSCLFFLVRAYWFFSFWPRNEHTRPRR